MKISKNIQQLLLLIFVLFTSSKLVAQTNQKLYNGLTDLDSKSASFFKANNINVVTTVDSRYFAPNPNGNIDFNLFAKSLNIWFPNSASKGIAALDWEGGSLQALHNSPNTNSFKNALNQYIQLIKFAKKMRPNVKWGYYSIPFTTYWGRDSKWQQLNQNILPLLKECDILFPSLYVFYQQGSEDKAGNISYAQDNMMECLKLGVMINKPVLPYVWNRYHNSNKKIGLELIPINDFTAYIKAILNTSYLDEKAAGIVWWGADKYFYRVKSKALTNEFTHSNNKNFNDYDDYLTVEYGTQILKAINGK
ncbi:hypothetical protein [Arachidicoccus soli]|uniref:Hyaluronidase n=1 Tax=Arachidicoccus soli TaxID=2341117 RepID=A0A386HRV1_9BACT|nr:hypothetical protein [Arachidicoccus soli]AYD47984.1 hypothetical protein D6B99_10510 [Arachidicoccus soli]